VHESDSTTETEVGRKNRLAKEDAKWQSMADVDWNDLEYYIVKARRNKDKEDFDTAIRILTALKKQCLERP
jgi:hypothetical protein